MPTVRYSEQKAQEEKRRLDAVRRETRQYYGFGVLSAKAIKVCGGCGSVCRADETFCTECGVRLPEKNLYEKSIEGVPKCPHCGAVLAGREKYCPNCGKGLQAAV